MPNTTLARSKISRWAMTTAACIGLAAAGTGFASAQEIEPNDYVPAPAGVNLAIGYYLFGHKGDEFKVNDGGKLKNSSLLVNVGIARYVHYTTLFDHPAGYQVLEAFGSLSDGKVGGAKLPDAFGASKLILSAFIWPYASTEKKQYLFLAGYVYPPTGTYDKNAPLNLASAFDGSAPGWSGDATLAWDQGIGEHFSYDVGFDVRAYGDVTGGAGNAGLRTTTDPEFRFQTWLNWNWTRAFNTGIGFEGFYGGKQSIAGVNTRQYINGERQIIRAAAGYFFLPNAQVLLELNHDVHVTNGFSQDIGATARFVYIF